MTKCFNCHQEMPVDFINVFDLTELRQAIIDSDISWEYLGVDDDFYIANVNQGITMKAIAVEVENEWDSYGYPTGSGFVVFEIADGDRTKVFKVDGEQSSYSGWEWDERNIIEVKPTPKTVLTWESV